MRGSSQQRGQDDENQSTRVPRCGRGVTDSPGHAGQGGLEGADHGRAAPTRTKRPTTGACSRRRSSMATPTASSRTRRATSTCTTRCTRRATAPTRSSCSTRTGKFVRSWGKEFRGVAHGLWIRKEGRDEFLYLTVNAANPKMSPQPSMQAVARQDDAGGRDRVEDRRAAGLRRLQARAGRRARSLTTRPTSRSRRTATSTWATATARTS